MKANNVFNVMVYISVATIYSFVEIVFFPAILCMFLLAIYKGRTTGLVVPSAVYLVFAVYVLFSLVWTFNFDGGTKASFYISFLYLAVFISATIIGSNPNNVQGFLFACILGFLTVNLRNFLVDSGGFYRLGGVAEQPNALGLISSAGAVICFVYYVLFFNTTSTIQKTVIITTGLLSGYFLIRSGSRGAFISLLAPIFLYYFRFSRRIRVKSLLLFFMTLLLVSAIAYKFSDAAIFNRLLLLPNAIGLDLGLHSDDRFEYSQSADSSRITMAEVVLREFMNRPVFGHGVGSFKYYSDFTYTHNSYLELIFTLGLFGLVLVYGPVLYVFYKTLDSRLGDNDLKLRLAIRSLVYYFLLSGLSIPHFQNKSQIYPLIAILVLYILLARKSKLV